MTSKSLDQIIQNFDPTQSGSTSELKDGGAVTIWLPPEYKIAYDNLQRQSNRRFCKKAREILMAAIDVAQARAS